MENLTIRDVAKKAGVSHTTVSHVINNTGRISEATRKRVLQIIDEMNYYPNESAKALATNKRDTIAFVSPRLAAPFISSVMAGFENRAYSLNKYLYGIEQYSTRSVEVVKKELLLKILYGKKANALVMLSLKPDEKMLAEYNKKNVPVILIENEMKGAHSIKVDNYKGSYEAVEYLIKKGRKNIGLITGEKIPAFQDEEIGSDVPGERIKAYKDALEKNGIEYDEKKIFQVHYHNLKEGQDGLISLLTNNKDLDAIFCAGGDIVAIGVIKEAKVRGIKIPDDIAVIGYDNIWESEIVSPKLTTVNQPIEKMGEVAFDLTIDSIEGRLTAEKNIVFIPELIIRESA